MSCDFENRRIMQNRVRVQDRLQFYGFGLKDHPSHEKLPKTAVFIELR